MRPDRMPAAEVKIRPWYYTERKTPSRSDALAKALREEAGAEGEPDSSSTQ